MRRREQTSGILNTRMLEEYYQELGTLLRERPKILFSLLELSRIYPTSDIVKKYLQFTYKQLTAKMQDAIQHGIDPLNMRHVIDQQLIEAELLRAEDIKAQNYITKGHTEPHMDFINDAKAQQQFDQVSRQRALDMAKNEPENVRQLIEGKLQRMRADNLKNTTQVVQNIQIKEDENEDEDDDEGPSSLAQDVQGIRQQFGASASTIIQSIRQLQQAQDLTREDVQVGYDQILQNLSKHQQQQNLLMSRQIRGVGKDVQRLSQSVVQSGVNTPRGLDMKQLEREVEKIAELQKDDPEEEVKVQIIETPQTKSQRSQSRPRIKERPSVSREPTLPIIEEGKGIGKSQSFVSSKTGKQRGQIITKQEAEKIKKTPRGEKKQVTKSEEEEKKVAKVEFMTQDDMIKFRRINPFFTAIRGQVADLVKIGDKNTLSEELKKIAKISDNFSILKKGTSEYIISGVTEKLKQQDYKDFPTVAQLKKLLEQVDSQAKEGENLIQLLESKLAR